jgi:hypothetical protein
MNRWAFFTNRELAVLTDALARTAAEDDPQESWWADVADMMGSEIHRGTSECVYENDAVRRFQGGGSTAYGRRA